MDLLKGEKMFLKLSFLVIKNIELYADFKKGDYPSDKIASKIKWKSEKFRKCFFISCSFFWKEDQHKIFDFLNTMWPNSRNKCPIQKDQFSDRKINSICCKKLLHIEIFSEIFCYSKNTRVRIRLIPFFIVPSIQAQNIPTVIAQDCKLLVLTTNVRYHCLVYL